MEKTEKKVFLCYFLRKSSQEITQKDFRTGSTKQDRIIWHRSEVSAGLYGEGDA